MTKVFCFLSATWISTLLIATKADVYSQRRHVLNYTEQWTQGRIDDTRHVVDSFFYENGAVKEVVESLIKRERFVVIDSISINQRKLWTKDKQLYLVENFDNKTGRIQSIHCTHPPNFNIIHNGSFNINTESPSPHSVNNDSLDMFCESLISIRKQALFKKEICNSDTMEYVLITDSLLCLDKYNIHTRKHLIKNLNGKTVDSIFLGQRMRIAEIEIASKYRQLFHQCNYDSIIISIPAWESIYRKSLPLFNAKERTPYHPYYQLYDATYDFKEFSDNSVLYISGSQGYGCPHFEGHRLIQTTLSTTISPQDTYYLEFRIWKPYSYTNGNYAPRLQVCFSQEKVTRTNYEQYFNQAFEIKEFIDMPAGTWVKVQLKFLPKEFSRYMTIGFFGDLNYRGFIQDNKLKRNNRSEDVHYAKCFVDDFILVPFSQKDSVQRCFYDESSILNPKNTHQIEIIDSIETTYNNQKVKKETPILLQNIQFEHNSYELLPESNFWLSQFASFLRNNPNIKIRISGHTDNSGKEEYNKELSSKRAEVVVFSLIKLGIETERLLWEAFGSSIPIGDNLSEEGRAKNRRVEFVIL